MNYKETTKHYESILLQLADLFDKQDKLIKGKDCLLANCYRGFKLIYDKSNDIDVRITCSNAKILMDKHYEKQKHGSDS